MAALAIPIGVALAVARLGVGAAAAAHPDIPRLDRPRLVSGGVVEISLDRCRRATETRGDLTDRKPLAPAEVARQRDRAATLKHAVTCKRRPTGVHPLQVLPTSAISPIRAVADFRAEQDPDTSGAKLRRASNAPLNSCLSRARTSASSSRTSHVDTHGMLLVVCYGGCGCTRTPRRRPWSRPTLVMR